MSESRLYYFVRKIHVLEDGDEGRSVNLPDIHPLLQLYTIQIIMATLAWDSYIFVLCTNLVLQNGLSLCPSRKN
jgi:hypothetical protein